MSVASENHVYPAVMDHKLRQIRRRQCGLALARAALLAAAALMAAMLAAMLADAKLTLFDSGVRLTLTAAALSFAAVTLIVAAVRPLVRALELRGAAAAADRQAPLLEERWTTVASFAEQGRRPQSPLGRAMLRQVTDEAVALGQLVEPARVARPDALRKPLALAAACLLALIVFLGLDWRRNLVLFERFWSPLADISATRIESLSGDLVIPRGEAVEIAARISGLPREKATIFLEREGKETEILELAPDGERLEQCNYRLASLEDSFRYRWQAGDGRTPWYSVAAIDRPELAEVRLTLTAPAYVDRPKYEKTYLPDRLRTLEGSRLSLQLRPKAALEKLELRVTRGVAQGETDAGQATTETLLLAHDATGWYRFETTLTEDVTLSPMLLSPEGLINEDQPRCLIQVIADRPPVARVISPDDELAVSPDEVVDVKFEADDDHGVARAELIVYQEPPFAGQPPTILSSTEIPLGGQRLSRHVAATARLELAKLALSEGENISFAVRVTDNRHVGLDPEAASQRNRELSASGSDAGDPRDRDQQQVASLASREPGENAGAVAQERLAPNGADSDPGELQAFNPKTEVENEPAQREQRQNTDPIPAEEGRDQQHTAGNVSLAVDQRDDAESARPDSLAIIPRSETKEGDEKRSTEERSSAPGANAVAAAASDEKSPPEAAAAAGPRQPDLGPRKDRPRQAEAASNALAENAGGVRQAANPPDDKQFAPHPDSSGQNAETERMRLKIASRVASAAESTQADESDPSELRAGIVRIDGELEIAETSLEKLAGATDQTELAAAQVEELGGVDERLAEVERLIAALRSASKDTPYAFAGLQMAELGGSQISPARDRVFVLLRQPHADVDSNLIGALHRVSRARELLAELLARYDRAVRERKLADSLEEVAKIYEVYVKGVQRLLRGQSQPSANPLQRKMAVVEVDQEYLDRLREVEEMRRDLMSEFGRLLADDPRLLGKYMDLIKRRQQSLRDSLDELHRRQETLASELTGWRQSGDAQREDVWLAAAELRLQDAATLAREASQLEERSKGQLPLGLAPGDGAAAAVLDEARQAAELARAAAVKSRRLIHKPLDKNTDLIECAEALAYRLDELDASIERLGADHRDAETAEFVAKRQFESRALGERVAGWRETVSRLERRQYHGLALVDERRLAAETEQLRLSLARANRDLAGQFRGEVPAPIQAAARDLESAMEAITFHQMAASFSLSAADLAAAETQHSLALAAFERAEELFDSLRQLVIDELDQVDPENPSVADLEDPTIDQFLERLEREPELTVLLGIPDRPRNLRVISDWMLWNEQGGSAGSMEEAAARARQRAEEEQLAQTKPRPAGEDDDLTEQEWRRVADAEQAEELLQKKIDELRQQAADPQLNEEQAEQLRQMAEQLEALRKQLDAAGGKGKQWEEIVRSDQLRAVMKALASSEPLPDNQWNRILSSLDEGLWQVRRKAPPEHYRRAIEQYQERIRRLKTPETSDATRP